MLSSFKLSIDKFKKKKPNIFQLAPNIKLQLNSFEDKHRLSPAKSRSVTSNIIGTMGSVDSDREKPHIPSYQFFVTENIVESPKFSQILDADNSDAEEVEKGAYVEFRIPKAWIDEASKDKVPLVKKSKENANVAQGSRTLKFCLMVIKCKLKLGRILARIRRYLKTAEYYHIYLKTSFLYQKLSDGSFLKTIIIQDIVHQGFNNGGRKESKDSKPSTPVSKPFQRLSSLKERSNKNPDTRKKKRFQ